MNGLAVRPVGAGWPTPRVFVLGAARTFAVGFLPQLLVAYIVASQPAVAPVLSGLAKISVDGLVLGLLFLPLVAPWMWAQLGWRTLRRDWFRSTLAYTGESLMRATFLVITAGVGLAWGRVISTLAATWLYGLTTISW